MRVTLRIWARLARHRGVPGTDASRGHLPTLLAVVAFAAATWAALTVAGGTVAFVARARAPAATVDEKQYPVLAAVACVLLSVPVGTLGAAAARLTVARRNLRLARLRLVGATAVQVTLTALLDATLEALTGAVAGVVLWLVTLPALARVPFQGRAFAVGELVVPPPGVLAAVTAVLAIALLSCVSSLRRVAVTPLGVVRRVTPPHLRLLRAVPVVVLALGFTQAVHLVAGRGMVIAVAVLLVLLGGTFALYNLLGPLLVGLVGRLLTRRARSAAGLIAARRLVDDPRSAWRGVSGVALVTFVAGLLSVTPGLEADAGSASEEVFLRDIGTGAICTLAIASLMAAVSTGVTQAARVLDQAPQYRALHLGGVDLAVLHAARSRETWLPLVVTMGGAAATAMVLVSPFAELLSADLLGGVAVFAAAAAVGAALVVLAARASRPLLTAVATGDRPRDR